MADKTFNRRLNIYVNEKDVGKGFKNIRREIAAANKRISSGKLSLEEYYKEVDRIGQLKGTLKNHKNNINDATKQWTKAKVEAKGLTNGIFGFGKALGGAGGFIAAGTIGVGILTEKLISGATALFHAGVEMEVLSKKAEKVFGEALPLVTAEAEKNANQIGLTISQYTDMSAAIGDLLIPMGFQRTEAAAISTQLVNLSGALSEWSGGVRTSTEVNQILSKALLGEREGLKQLGISIQEADVKARLADKGLDKLTGTMLQQAKAAATLELILEKSADAQDAYAQNSDTLVRKQAEINAKFGEIKDTLTAALIPVFSRLVNAAVPFADILAKTIKLLIDGEEPTGKYAKSVKFLSLAVLGIISQFTAWFAAGKVIMEDILTPLYEIVDTALSPAFELLSRLTRNNTKTTITLADSFNFLAKGISFTLKPLSFLLKGFSEIYRNAMPNIIKGLEITAVKLAQFQNIAIDAINAVSKFGGIDPIPKLDIDAVSKLYQGLGESAGKSFEKGLDKTNAIPSVSAPTFNGSKDLAINNAGNGIDQKAIDRAKKQTEKEAEAKAKVQEKANQERLKKIEEFNAEIQKLEEDQFLNALSDKQRALEDNKRYYNDLISQARGLFGEQSEQEAELEFQKQQRVLEIQNEFALIKEEQEAERNAKRLEQQEELLAKIAELNRSALEQDLFELEEQYEALKESAEKFGIDTTGIEKKYEAEKDRIKEEFSAKEKARTAKEVLDQQKKYEALYKAIGSAFTILAELIGNESSAAAAFQKAVALAQIAFETGKAIAGAIAQAQTVPFPGNIAAIATGVASVIAAISQAKSVLNSATVPQRKEGGHFEVTGQDDNRTYNARYAARPRAGFLPPGPQLILANERGTEYFVPNHLLTHPVVADQVAIIEAIRTGNTIQKAEGGFSVQPRETNNPAPSNNAEMVTALNNNTTINMRLLERIDAGIYVLIGEDDARDIDKLINKTKEKEG